MTASEFFAKKGAAAGLCHEQATMVNTVDDDASATSSFGRSRRFRRIRQRARSDGPWGTPFEWSLMSFGLVDGRKRSASARFHRRSATA
jgi:hypothetical protein